MTHNHMHTKEFIIGAAVGSLLGSVAALLAAPKSGKRLREDISDAYCDASEGTAKLANRGKSLAKDIGCHTCDWSEKAKHSVGNLRDTLKSWMTREVVEEDEEGNKDWLIGGLAGSVLGAVVGLLLAPKSGEDLRHDIVDGYEDVSEKAERFVKKGKSFAKSAQSKTNKWLDLAKDVIEQLSDNAQDTSEEWVEKAKSLVKNDRINDVMDWAALGFRVWNGIKSKR